jgi:hypothetical protein
MVAAEDIPMTEMFRDYRNLRILADQPRWLAFKNTISSRLGMATGKPLKREAASCVDGPRLARVFLRDEQWSLAVMCPAFQCGPT